MGSSIPTAKKNITSISSYMIFAELRPFKTLMETSSQFAVEREKSLWLTKSLSDKMQMEDSHMRLELEDKR